MMKLILALAQGFVLRGRAADYFRKLNVFHAHSRHPDSLVLENVCKCNPAYPSSSGRSLDDLLADKSLWRSSRPDTSTLFGGDDFKIPRMGRSEQIAEIWKELHNVILWETYSRRSILYLHGSPGMGKSYLLRQIASKSKDCVVAEKHKFVESARILSLDLSRNCIADVAHLEISDGARRLLPTARIYYTEFGVGCKLSWETFFAAVAQECWSTSEMDLRQQFESKIMERLLVDEEGNKLDRSQVKVILLVDDIINTDKLRAGVADAYRSQVCGWINRRLCDGILFSTVDEPFIEREVSVGKRGVKPACSLPLLDLNMTIPILRNVFETSQLTMADAEGNRASSEYVSRALGRLAGVTGGHPRSVVNMVRALQTLAPGSTVSCSRIRSIVDEAAEEFVRSCCTSNVSALSWSVLVKKALVAERTSRVGVIPALKKFTYEDLINRGYLVDSFTGEFSDEVVPNVPELLVHYWLKMALPSKKDREMRKHLNATFSLADGFTPVRFESIMSDWERVMTTVRQRRTFGSVSTRKLYRLDDDRGECSLADECKVNATTPLEMQTFESGALKVLAANTIYVPADPQSAGFDSVIVREVVDGLPGSGRYLLPMFVQYKWSEAGGAAKISVEGARAAYEQCKEAFGGYLPQEGYGFMSPDDGGDPFLFLMAGPREARVDVKCADAKTLPANVLLGVGEGFASMVGPMFMYFLRSLFPDDVVF